MTDGFGCDSLSAAFIPNRNNGDAYNGPNRGQASGLFLPQNLEKKKPTMSVPVKLTSHGVNEPPLYIEPKNAEKTIAMLIKPSRRLRPANPIPK